MPNHALLTPQDHGELRIRTDRTVDLGDGMMCCLTVPSEFRQVQDEYPILFRRNAEHNGFTALAMFGFDQGENLFLDQDWDARYLPLALAIQPFLIGRARPDSVEKQVHVDLDSPRVGMGEGVRVFDEFGRPTPYLETIAEQLGALDEGYRDSSAFFDALDRHDLLEPLTLEVTLSDGSTNRLVGFHVIDEDKLRDLDGTALADLHDAGHLMPIFMAVASLGRLNALIDRKNRRLSHG